LGVTTATRSHSLPDVPTVGETISGYEVNGWIGVGAPAGTPPEVIERLNREINAGLLNPGIKARLAEVGTTPMAITAAEFGELVAADTEKWAKVIKFGGIKPE
jgi:tripartite-type tricarboxylate transporter receptor subunit TctC